MQAKHTISLLFFISILIYLSEVNSMMVGGASAVKKADAVTQEIAEKLKTMAETKCNEEFSKFDVVEYKTQVVAGVNYFMKIDVGNDEFIHIRVFKPLPHTNEEPSLVSCQKDKMEKDPLNYF